MQVLTLKVFVKKYITDFFHQSFLKLIKYSSKKKILTKLNLNIIRYSTFIPKYFYLLHYKNNVTTNLDEVRPNKKYLVAFLCLNTFLNCHKFMVLYTICNLILSEFNVNNIAIVTDDQKPSLQSLLLIKIRSFCPLSIYSMFLNLEICNKNCFANQVIIILRLLSDINTDTDEKMQSIDDGDTNEVKR